eukprot:8694347-Pyramimonas_sp.AAC.1
MRATSRTRPDKMLQLSKSGGIQSGPGALPRRCSTTAADSSGKVTLRAAIGKTYPNRSCSSDAQSRNRTCS